MKPKTHREVIELINERSLKAGGDKLHKLLNIQSSKVRDWKYHNKIAAKYYGKVAYYAYKHGIKVTVIGLEQMAEQQ